MYYHEGVARKSPNEVCSIIYEYILKEIPEETEHLHIFSDGCGGQNKNHTLIRLCLAIVHAGRFKSVNQYFPIRGHSFLPCDRDFAVVKRKIKKVDRFYTVKEIADIIVSSSQQGKFSVTMVENEQIKDFKAWWSAYYKRNTPSVESRGRGIPREEKVSFQI